MDKLKRLVDILQTTIHALIDKVSDLEKQNASLNARVSHLEDLITGNGMGDK